MVMVNSDHFYFWVVLKIKMHRVGERRHSWVNSEKQRMLLLGRLRPLEKISSSPSTSLPSTHSTNSHTTGLQNPDGSIIEPICCPCGPKARQPHKCGSPFTAIIKGKPNTAHCLRFGNTWYSIYEVGKRSIGFSIRVEVKRGSAKSEIILGPENRNAISSDNLLKASLVGDFGGYDSIPSFENLNLVTPRNDSSWADYSKWMLLERYRFGPFCDQIGVSYKAFNGQPISVISHLEAA